MKNNKSKLFYLCITILLVILEVYIAIYVHDDFIRPIVGDFIVVWLLYCFVRIFIKQPPKYLALYVFVFAGLVEISQYFHLVELLHVEDITFLRVLLGTTFDVWDIVAYGIGCVILFIYQKYIEKA